MHKILLMILLATLLASCGSPSQIDLGSTHLHFEMDEKGYLTQLVDRNTGVNYLSTDTAAPLLSLRVNGEMVFPLSAKLGEAANAITLRYPSAHKATVRVLAQESHIRFELVELSDAHTVELVVWGPYPTTLNTSIGETVGVAQGEDYALGIQALNPKTLGGYPWQENDAMPQIDIFDQEDLSDLSEKGKRYVLYRVEAAKPTSYGSSLQAYCRNRSSDRVIPNWQHERYLAPAWEDGGLLHTGIALFGCPVNETLETIGHIEEAEGLPHPQIDGEWGKQARSASAAYVILGYSEENLDKAIAITKKAGLRYLYHPGPFENWGHFELQEKSFPNDWESMRRCVERAEAEGLMMGLHTLSNFITTDDPYVTPTPDARLAKVGASFLTERIDAQQTEIEIAEPGFFNQFENNHLKTVQVGNELIRYGKVSESEPWRLLDCQRGAWDTRAARHSKGETIEKLADHGYKVFLSNTELSIEMAETLAFLYNETGLRQISFDGLEGNRSTGMGNYGEILFTQTWYDNLNENVKSHYIADASRTDHFFWHMYTRMNWGEPWYDGFRESQTEYRMKNQAYFKRNFMPAMLGWFSYTDETSVEDIQWMLNRSAAFNAGYAFFTTYEAIDKNGNSEEVLAMVGEWEKARMADAFSEDQKTRMEDISTEFKLEALRENQWELFPIYTQTFRHNNRDRQPGEPEHSVFSMDNPDQKQHLGFILTAVDGDLRKPRLEINNYKSFKIPVNLKKGEILKYTGGDKATLYDANWQEKKQVKVDEEALQVAAGAVTVNFDCGFKGGKEATAKLELRVMGEGEFVGKE